MKAVKSLKGVKDGAYFKATIKNTKVEGRIRKEGDTYYLCQNKKDGNSGAYKYGYKFSWTVEKGTPSDLINPNIAVYNLMVSATKPKGFKAPKAPPVPIAIIADHAVEFLKGKIKIGCTEIPNSVCRKIVKHLKD